MGCDIHAAIEFRGSDGKWAALMVPNKHFGRWDGEAEYTSRVDINRDYDLFAVLGNVRNGTGFAGCDMGDGFDSISDRRGVPEDISDAAKEALSDEHSATWVTLAEILAFDWDRATKHRGWVSSTEFEKWDRMKEWNPAPKSYCGGGNFKKITVEEMREAVALKENLGHTCCQLEWEESYTASTTQMWTRILPKMLKLGCEHGFDNVRLVMDFDS